jgi:hypothetical protein
MRVIVQKYGGKCVEPGGNELVTAERVMETRDRGDYPVVVVSAMGRELRDPRAFIEKLMHRPEEWRDAALAHFYSTAELVRLVRDIDPDIEPRELDMLMSCGEIISTVRLAHLLKAKGYSTVALSGGQVGLITDGFFGHARVIQTEIRQLLEILDRPAIPLVAGFQGVSPVDHAHHPGRRRQRLHRRLPGLRAEACPAHRAAGRHRPGHGGDLQGSGRGDDRQPGQLPRRTPARRRRPAADRPPDFRRAGGHGPIRR